MAIRAHDGKIVQFRSHDSLLHVGELFKVVNFAILLPENAVLRSEVKVADFAR